MFIHPTSSRDGGPQDGSRDHRTVQKTSCKKQLKDLFVITVPLYAIRIRTSEPSRSVPWRLHLSWQLRPLQRHVETLSDPQELQKRWQRRVEDLVVAVPPKSRCAVELDYPEEEGGRGGTGTDESGDGFKFQGFVFLGLGGIIGNMRRMEFGPESGLEFGALDCSLPLSSVDRGPETRHLVQQCETGGYRDWFCST